MEDIIAELLAPALAALVAFVVGVLLPQLRVYVAKTDNKVDDVILAAVEKGIRDAVAKEKQV